MINSHQQTQRKEDKRAACVLAGKTMEDMPRGLGNMLWKEKLALAAERVQRFMNINQARLDTMFEVGSEWMLEDNEFPARDGKVVQFLRMHKNLAGHGYVKMNELELCVPLGMLFAPPAPPVSHELQEVEQEQCDKEQRQRKKQKQPQHETNAQELENPSQRHRPVRTAAVAVSATPHMCSSVHDQNLAMGFLCEQPCGMYPCDNVLQQHLVTVQDSQLVLDEQGLFANAPINEGTLFATFGPLISCKDPAPTGSVRNYKFPIRPTGGGAKQWFVPKQPGLTQHKAHWINHQCCHQHCNAAYMQTETSTGEFLMVARATRHIQKGEEIFANYNNIGDETCAFSMPNCMCYSCKDKSKNP
jgi:hypothetical protein